MGKRTKWQTIQHLPQDIIEDILVNLPVKSLLRFKCVSKPWHSLISSKHFTNEHLKKSSDLIRHNLICSSYDYVQTGYYLRSCSLKSFLDEQNYEDYSMFTTSNHDSLMPSSGSAERIVGSCNGLILMSTRINVYWCNLILWNPSTRQVKVIPPPPFAQRKRYRNSDHFVYGFGYDGSNDDYKVVSIFVSEPGPYKTRMYSLRTNSWKKIRNFEKGQLLHCSGTHVNGKLHWLAAKGDGGGGSDRDIVSLSLVDEEYDIVALPLQFPKYDGDCYYILNDSGGYLSLIRFDSIILVELWVMMKYGEVESWTNIWIGLNLSDPMRPFNGPRPRPIWLSKNGDGDVVVAVSGSKVVVSNGKNKSRVYAVDAEILRRGIYVESLVSLDQKLGQ